MSPQILHTPPAHMRYTATYPASEWVVAAATCERQQEALLTSRQPRSALTKRAAIEGIAAQTTGMAEDTHGTIVDPTLTCTADAAVVHFKYLLPRLHHKRVIDPDLPCISGEQHQALKTGSADI